MNSSKSENSISSSHVTGSEAIENRKKALAGQITPTYESATFSRPAVDQLNGILPDFNRRLSPEKDLGLSPLGHSRLSPETFPRLFSSSFIGLSTSEFPETLPRAFEEPVAKGFDAKPDLAGRTLKGAEVCSKRLSSDLPIAPLGSRLATLRQKKE